MAKNSEQGMEFLYSSLANLVEPLQNIIPAATVNKQDEFEAFLGGKIPQEVEIHPPNDINSRGRCKRIKKGKEKKAPRKWMCGKCKQLVDHDARNCPNNAWSFLVLIASCFLKVSCVFCFSETEPLSVYSEFVCHCTLNLFAWYRKTLNLFAWYTKHSVNQSENKDEV